MNEKLLTKPIADFQLLEKELLVERRFGLIAILCNKIFSLQRKCKRDLQSLTIDYEKTKNGRISFNVWEQDAKLGVNKTSLLNLEYFISIKMVK